MTTDSTRKFLDSLPEIKQDESFWFSCHPAIKCFNACCSDLTMPLTPYDVLRLRQALSMNSEEFIEEFAIVGCYEDTGFPLLHLRMDDSPMHRCPFVTDNGCSVYENRSSACRFYPLGRATKPSDSSGNLASGEDIIVEEQYFLVREDHCKGFAEQRKWTINDWLSDQAIIPYMKMNDRYMSLMARYKALADKAILSGKHATMALLCLYQQDRFLDFIDSTKLFSRLDFQGAMAEPSRDEQINMIMNNAEVRLYFACDWIELVLFGSTANIKPRN